VNGLDVRMVCGFREDLGNHAPLIGNAQALFLAQRFYIDMSVHQ
jgi:hypothetical protein